MLGFKALRDLIGHEIVGECLDNEHYNDIGDSNQHTTGGLLAWRKADNWTAFTDGYRTWINGPNGLVQRLNTERFEWEADYADFASPSAAPALTRNALRNAEYAANFPSYGTLQRDRIGAQDPLAFGDLNGDGTDDAAVVLLLVDGNAGHRYLAAVLNENGVPRHVASVFLGLNIGIDSVAIANGVVTLQTKQLGPNDPNCCPTKEVGVTLKLTDNAWQLLAETPPGQITGSFAPAVPTPTPIARSQEGDQSCLTVAELDYLNAYAAAKFDSTDESAAIWARTRSAADEAYYAMPSFGRTRRQEEAYLNLASLAVEALRLHGLAVYAAIDSLPAAPTARTARLHELAMQYYQTIEGSYLVFVALYNKQLPNWTLVPAMHYGLVGAGGDRWDALFGEPPKDDILGIWTYWDVVVAEPRCY